MNRRLFLVGFLAISLQYCHASAKRHQTSIRLKDSDFHRYPPRILFTSDGRLVVAYRTSTSKNASTKLQIVVINGKTGGVIAKHSYAVPVAGPIKISDHFVVSRDGRSLYYVEQTGEPVVLQIDASSFDVLSESNTATFNAVDSISGAEGFQDDASAQMAAKIRYQNHLDDVVPLPSGRWIGRTNRSIEGSLQLFDQAGNREKTLAGLGCGFVSMQLTLDDTYGVSVCERTGTTEWTFGKILERKAVVFNANTMTLLESVPLSKKSLQTAIATDNWRIWYPQPKIWDSGQVILVAVPDFSGAIRIQELHP